MYNYNNTNNKKTDMKFQASCRICNFMLALHSSLNQSQHQMSRRHADASNSENTK